MEVVRIVLAARLLTAIASVYIYKLTVLVGQHKGDRSEVIGVSKHHPLLLEHAVQLVLHAEVPRLRKVVNLQHPVG